MIQNYNMAITRAQQARQMLEHKLCCTRRCKKLGGGMLYHVSKDGNLFQINQDIDLGMKETQKDLLEKKIETDPEKIGPDEGPGGNLSLQALVAATLGKKTPTAEKVKDLQEMTR